MTAIRNMLDISIVAALLLTSFLTGAQALGSEGRGLPPFGEELQRVTRITGSVVCVECDLNEVRAAQPGVLNLYQLNHPHGQLVMTVESVTESTHWERFVGVSRHISVGAPASLFQQLTAEENLFKEVVIRGLLSSHRMLDIGAITIADPNPALFSPVVSPSSQEREPH